MLTNTLPMISPLACSDVGLTCFHTGVFPFNPIRTPLVALRRASIRCRSRSTRWRPTRLKRGGGRCRRPLAAGIRSCGSGMLPRYRAAAWVRQLPVASSMAAYRKIPLRHQPAAHGRSATVAERPVAAGRVVESGHWWTFPNGPAQHAPRKAKRSRSQPSPSFDAESLKSNGRRSARRTQE